ncbi:unnamed protein product [Heligmosomoides polygyrus]|uniref:SDR family oxidoreductase n=1 Tax=Heligmosomoides polygyrus TaxID=6339 RepID=A0A183G6X5_HELPZ|nr:unnamed protein product [Heligmosomoides polygyrus]
MLTESPGLISTSIMQRSEGITDEIVRTAEKRVAAMPSCIPCGRAGTPDDVAEAILFLADRKRSGFIVGHQLVIDGGSSLQMPVICDGFNVFAEVAAEMGSKAQEH